MRVLITGGAGFLGSHLSDGFIARGDEVLVLDTGSIGKVRHLLSSARFHYIHDSIFNAEIIDSLVAKADLIYHLAAVVGVEHYVGDPYETLNVNVNGTQNILRAAYKYGRRVVFSSTSEVYGRNPKVPWREDDDRVLGSARLSRWFYASAKAIDEAFALAYWDERQLPVTVVRLFNTVGPRQTGVYGMVVPRFVRWALRGEPLRVYGDGQQTRCFTNVHDVVRALMALVDTPSAAGEIFNIGQPNEIRIVDLARRVIELTGSTSELKLVPYDAEEAYGERAVGFEDMRRRVPNAGKLYEYTGFRPSVGLDQTLREVIDYEMGRLETATRP